MTNSSHAKQPVLREMRFASPAARRDYLDLPEDVQRDFGHAIHEIQLGEDPWDAKALKGFPGTEVMELLESDQAGTYRAMYTCKFAGVVYVLHAFMKKSSTGIKTDPNDIQRVRERLKDAEKDYQDWLQKQQGGEK